MPGRCVFLPTAIFEAAAEHDYLRNLDLARYLELMVEELMGLDWKVGCLVLVGLFRCQSLQPKECLTGVGPTRVRFLAWVNY